MGQMEGGGDPQVLHGRGTRFRFDNGSETDDGVPPSGGGATWIAAIDSNISMPINHKQFRFRFCCTNEDGAESPRTQSLARSHNLGGYSLVSPITTIVEVVPSPNLTNLADSTDYGSAEDLYTAVYADLTNGCVIDLQLLTGNHSFPAPVRRMEAEYSIALIQADLSVGDTLDFRGFGAGVQYTDGYDFTPRITITAPEDQPEYAFIRQNWAILNRIRTR